MYKPSPLLDAILHHADTMPDKTAIVMNGMSVSYSSLVDNIKKAAFFLWKLGLKANDRIILSAHKHVEFIYFYFGAHVLGVTNVIVDAESNESRLLYIEDKVKPSFCFGYKSSNCPSLLFDELIFSEIEVNLQVETATFTSDNTAEILFTTGTTGNPKGVCLSYMNIFSSATNINNYINNTEEDVELLALPICHSFGLGRIRCTLLKGATIVILSSFANVRAFLKAIEDYHITGFGVVPAAWAYIRKISGMRISKYAAQIKYIELGSAAMSLSTKQEMLQIFPNTRICMHYGLTESSRTCFQEFHDTAHLETIGKPISDKVEIKIFDAKGNALFPFQKGEICVKGNMVLSHYLDERDNLNAFWGTYFRTGDCGFVDNEGYVHLLGREKELINVGGKKVSPMEVEDAIISLGVGDCVCVPIKDESGVMGELVYCFILKGSTSLSFEEISELLSQKLEVYKRPVGYEWIDEIPKTMSGKKQRIMINKK